MKVEVWSDVVCPWCWIGKRHLEAALGRFAHADEVEVVWRAFELDPSAVSDGAGVTAGGSGDAGGSGSPAVAGGGRPSYAARLAAKYGTDVAAGQQMVDTMVARGAQVGVDMRFDRAVAANTVDAHQVVHLAEQRGGAPLQDAMKERLMRAYFTEGEAVGDRDVLVRLAGEVGLDAEEVTRTLQTGAFVRQVRAEEAEAAALGATGVPFFVVDRRYGVAGAQGADALLQVLETAWEQRPALVPVVAGSAAGAGEHAGSPDGAACGPDGCAL